MRAIPTIYAGVSFRSRLEATWARHFDRMQLSWNYEPQGFELSNGVWYLPDFYLPTARAWAEVKGAHEERTDKLEQFAKDLWKESGADNAITDERAPMILKLTDNVLDFGYPGLLNVLGTGKFGSAVFTKCRICKKTTVVALWQSWCRNCSVHYEDPLDWMDEEFKLLDIPFERITVERR
jgi:hypothetical protein